MGKQKIRRDIFSYTVGSHPSRSYYQILTVHTQAGGLLSVIPMAQT